jgi:hypothetical protein
MISRSWDDHRGELIMAMKKPVPGAIDIQNAIENAAAAIDRAGVGKSNDMDMLLSIALAVQQLAYGTKQALQAIYDEVV